ncbi:MAG: aldo/keto reductase [Anaerolineaceae bacterium]|jgi:aryl-alcohol dehydrogenase-like predicted oxidoreductase
MDVITSDKHSGLEDVQFGIGTWAWGDRLFWGFGQNYQESDLRATFDFCLQVGLNFFDTAESYGQGRSESFLGEFLKTTSKPVKIATKFAPYPWKLGKGALLKSLRNSLKRLGLTRVDLYQMHFPIPILKIETWMEAMAEAYQSGLVAAVGVSNYDRSQTQRAFDALTRLGVNLAANQVEYHLLNRTIEKNGLLAQCKDLGVRLIAYSPLAQGVLTGKYTADNPPQGIRSTRYNRKYLAQIQPLIIQLRKIGAAHAGKTPAQISLNWVMCKGAVPIPGAKNIEQAEMNAGALGWDLSDEEVQQLDEFSDRVSKNSS